MALPVPPEIWGKIFSLKLDPTIAPLLLTQVCRDWRALVLSTPVLWNRISVIHGWVSRSGDYPLHISYSIHDRRPRPRSAYPLDHSFPAPIHWQTLTRFSGRGIYLNQAYAILQLVANLEEVKLSTDSAPFADAITTMTLPHLHKLTLVNDPVVLEWLTLSCSMASRRRSVRRRR
ncbi:hypothetical protein B0H14DRAFT_2756254 [Mycena olivaceomarginata]|nr:hypothetical protein B0H14DRAFT_2756254 [Mycena olivaceomarginata]